MDPYTAGLLLTIQTGFTLGSEALKFAQTEQGQKLIAQFLKDMSDAKSDMDTWNKFWAPMWKPVTDGIQALISGTLWQKIQPPLEASAPAKDAKK